MKKQLLTLSLLAASAAVLAQPTIQANQFDWLATPAFTYKYQAGQTAVAPGAAGANASWNFSGLPAGSNLAYTTAACPGDADCGIFANANQVVKVGTLGKVFYNKTSSALEEVGETGSNAVAYTDPMKWLQFPVTFNQTYSDSYVSASRSGTLTSTIDGYGTLTTPAGTYNGVLRQKIVDNTVVDAGGQTMNMTLTQYYWMTPGIPHYLMSIIITDITGLPVPVPSTYAVAYTTETGTIGIDDKAALALDITVYPNPASDAISIKTGSLRVESVAAFNMLGQQVLSKTFTGIASGVVTLDQPGLTAGCYFLKINTDKGLVTKQVVIR